MLTVGSLFAGIGGIDLGLERAGMQVRWQVENDPYCIRVLEKHWPNVKRYEDIREIKWNEVEPVSLICGGFPCQPVSVAGARKGDKDDRWLWPEFLRAIREVRPKYALVENVLGLLSIDDGRLARGVFGDLAELEYRAEGGVISALDVGAPHLRKRVFIVAHSSESRTRLEAHRSRGQERSTSATLESEVLRQEDWPSGSEGVDSSCADVPDSKSFDGTWTEFAHTNPIGKALGRRVFSSRPTRSDFWAVEPDVGRVADGIPSRVDRLKCLGSAVVPQVAEYIGKLIIESEKEVVISQ